ncbi:hypothetical protein C8Q80DRAFT_329674 [Daedaleopsis nitida]|nr:hypothetical protein C8Q80DRAFT_329674 [Daedaleopsis nitida]
MPTSLRPTAPTFIPSHITERYYHLISLCCSSMNPHRDDEGVEAFLDGCKERLARYPTQEQLYASITASSPPALLLACDKDYAPQLDFAMRAMCGWDTNGVPDYATALHALMEITALGKYTAVRDRRVALRSPSRETCGRANALAAWAYYQLLLPDAPCRNPVPLRREEMPRTGYSGPPQDGWRLFLYAVAHAADAARQKMVCGAVLEVGYRFRYLANVLRYLIPNHDYMRPLLVALREFHRPETRVVDLPPTVLIFQGQEEQIKYQVKQWVADLDQELRDYPDPFSEGKIGTPFHYRTINGDLNE